MNKLNNPDFSRAKNVHEFTVRNLKGDHIKLDIYKGFLCIFVNIGKMCPYALQQNTHFDELLDKFGDGLRILAFPCDQFGEQLGSPEEIAADAAKRNNKFTTFGKVDVNGEHASDVWRYLKYTLAGSTKYGDVIKTNYTTFIVNQEGIPVFRLGPEIEPAEFEKLLEFFL